MGRTLTSTAGWSAPQNVAVRARHLLFAGAAVIGLVHFTVEMEGADRFAVHFGTIQIYLFDILALCLGGAGAVLALRRRRWSWVDALLLAILLLTLTQFVRGFLSHGTQAGVELRQDAFVLAGLMFMMGTSSYYRHSRRDFLIILGFYVGAGLLIYAVRALGLAPPSEFNLQFNLGTWRVLRFVGADEAFGLFAFALACLSLALRGSRPSHGRRPDNAHTYWLLGAAAVLLAFVAMHRSVWAVGVTCLPVFYIVQRRYRLMTRYDTELLFVSVLFLLAVIAAALLTSATLQNALAEVTAVTSTWNWRTAGWESLIELMIPSDYLLGRGYGADYSRWVFGRIIANSAHNFYLAKLWQLGAVGLALYLVLYGRVIVALARIARRPADAEQRALAALLLPLICGELVFFVVYANWIPSILIMGYALGFVRTASLAPASAPADRV